MTAATPRPQGGAPQVPAPAPSRPLAPPVLRSLRWLLRTYLVLGGWFVGIFGVLWAGAVLVALQLGPIGQSMAQFARQGATWFPFSVAISVLVAYHAVHVAAGMTRRSLAAATLIASAAMSVLVSTVMAGLFGIERVLYAAQGWQHRIIDAGWFDAPADDLPAIFGWTFLVVMAAQVSGLLVGVVYQRGGAWWGTLTLPLTAGPILGLWWVLARGVQEEWLTTGVRIGLAVLVSVVLAAAYLVLLRGLQLRPPRT